MTSRSWQITYKLKKVGGKYFHTTVEASTQYYANQIFDASMPSAFRCGSARAL